MKLWLAGSTAEIGLALIAAANPDTHQREQTRASQRTPGQLPKSMARTVKNTTKPFAEPVAVATMRVSSGSAATSASGGSMAKAEHIKHYKCPDCSSKKIRSNVR